MPFLLITNILALLAFLYSFAYNVSTLNTFSAIGSLGGAAACFSFILFIAKVGTMQEKVAELEKRIEELEENEDFEEDENDGE